MYRTMEALINQKRIGDALAWKIEPEGWHGTSETPSDLSMHEQQRVVLLNLLENSFLSLYGLIVLLPSGYNIADNTHII